MPPVNASLKNLARDGRFSLDDAKTLKQLVAQGKVTQEEAKETLTRYGDVMDAEAGQLLEGFTGGARGGAMTGLPQSTLSRGSALKKGVEDDDVRSMQRGLMALGMRERNTAFTLPSGADGKFGDETLAAVKAFQ